MARAFGKYQLLKRLATGGMAEIFLARQTGILDFEKIVVIKKLLPHLAQDKQFVDMFLDEARIAARLNHPNIIQIYDLGKVGSSFYIAMEYLAGQSLATVARRSIERKDFIRPPFSAWIISAVCAGLHNAHELSDGYGKHLGLVHRDISPQNIVITYEGGVKLVDFGIAKAEGKASRTQAGALKGKFSYMSPEQCQGKNLDCRSDIFSLGIVLYELVTGVRLFKHESELMILKAITEGEIKPPRAIRKDLPESLEQVVLRSLAYSTEDRYQTALDMQAELDVFLRQSSVAPTNVTLASYMKRLFADDMAVEKKMMELVRSDKFEDLFLDESFAENTQESFPGVSLEQFQAEASTRDQMVSHSGLSSPGGYASQVGPRRKFSPLIFLGSAIVLLAGLLAVFYIKQAMNRSSASEAPRKASLVVQSTPPGARIYLDGDLLTASTPTTIPGMAPDTSTKIRLELEGYEPWEESIRVFPGETERVIKAQLAALMVISTGSLSIETKPTEVQVFIDGVEHQNRTPILIDMMEGPHDIKLVKEGYQTLEERVEIKAGAQEKLERSLKALKRAKTPKQPANNSQEFGFLTLHSSPWADVYLGGRKLGPTPLWKHKLPAGSHTLTLKRKDLGITKSLKVTIYPDKTTKKSMAL